MSVRHAPAELTSSSIVLLIVIWLHILCVFKESCCSSMCPTSDLCELGLRCKFCAVEAQQTTNTMAVLISCIFGCVCVTVWVRSLCALLRLFLRTPLSGLCTYELIRRRPCARCPCIIFGMRSIRGSMVRARKTQQSNYA